MSSGIGLLKVTAASIPTPAAGEQIFFIDIADDKLKKKLENGSVVLVESVSVHIQTLLSGNIDPTSLVGEDGDFYINTATSTLFGAKISGAWGSGTSLIGVSGSILRTGVGVPSNGLGVNGDYYLDTAAPNTLYFKTGGSYVAQANLQGAQGVQGIQGIQGVTGNAGVDGSTWRTGIGAPSNGLGLDGDYYMNISTSDYYKKASGVYALEGNLNTTNTNLDCGNASTNYGASLVYDCGGA